MTKKAPARSIPWNDLKKQSEKVRARAHAPYSKYRVGAALMASDGRIFVGANIENASYGLCLCAERSALAAALAQGARKFTALAVSSPGPEPATPCGMCRQVLAEFPPTFEIRCYAPGGRELRTSVKELLPFAFGPSFLEAAKH